MKKARFLTILQAPIRQRTPAEPFLAVARLFVRARSGCDSLEGRMRNGKVRLEMENQNSKTLYETYIELTARAIPSPHMTSVEETLPVYIFRSEEEVELWERLYKELGQDHAEFCKRLHKELRENHAEWLKDNLSPSELSKFKLDQST